MVNELRIRAVTGIGEVVEGADLASLIVDALAGQGDSLQDGDILVVTQKIVSKAEGRVVKVDEIEPSPFAESIAKQGHRDARHYEIVLRESARIVRMDRGVLITETHHGWICANSGVDESNVAGGRTVTLLPVDSDHSAGVIRHAIKERLGVEVAVIVTDTFGRAWRHGQVNFAIGVSGINAVTDYRGLPDAYGYEMHATAIAIADELAAAGELVMNKTDQVPVALIRGYRYEVAEEGSSRQLLRDPAKDMFR